ncbi:hypothetical protein ACQV2C_12210 [Pantoea allii]|uniref:hypothetical protein n=1 Tax=Pantoea allii TaxID=574096 RepID=UPI003D3159C1
MSTDVRIRLTNIFETGVFYNAAIDLYHDQIKIVDDLYETVLSYPTDMQESILILISCYHLEKNLEKSKKYNEILSAFPSSSKLISIVDRLKLKLNLCWDLRVLNKKTREDLRPENLLNEYFNLYRVTKGFSVFNEDDLTSIIERLSFLELLRKKNTFFKNIVSIHRDPEMGTIHIFYDELKTSFRQALIFAYDNSSGNDSLEFIRKTIKSRNLKNYSGILMSLSFNKVARGRTISKEAYYDEIHEKYIIENNMNLNDKRVIYRGSQRLDNLKDAIKSKYELNFEDYIQQDKVFNRKEISDIDDRVSAYITVLSALSAYVNLYAFIIANDEFFKKLYELKKLIKQEFTSRYESDQLDWYVSLLLNFLNDSIEKSSGSEMHVDLGYLNDKYSSELRELRSYNVQKKYWGYFINKEIFPSLEKIITIVSLLNETSGEDYSSISHEQLDYLGLTDTLKKSMLINMLIPIKSNMISAGYGKNDHAIVTPINDKNDVPGNIRSALRLYDKNAKNDFLISTISINKTSKIEEVIWGLFHHYEMKFSEYKVTSSVTINKIDKIYKKTISETRFSSGVQACKKIINTFTENMIN